MLDLVLNDGTTYSASNGELPGTVTVFLDKYSDMNQLESSLLKQENLKKVVMGDVSYENMSTMDELIFTALNKNGKIEVSFMLMQKSEQEIDLETKEESIEIATTYLTDNQALTVKDLYKKWEDDPEGYSYRLSNPEDLRRQYSDGLWKLQKDHEKQSSWYPGSDPTLWTEIVEEHDGSKEDPIPVPDSVLTSGYEYVYGKYYLEVEQLYFCSRQGIPNPEELYGQTVKLYYFPSTLLGQYFVLEENE